MSYIISIKTAIIIFPIIAFLFTIPFILHQYHKYGSINKLRVLIIYSFILYMMCIYFLVILPLPKRSEVTSTYKDMIQLKPFSFIIDFFKETSLNLKDFSTYIKALKEPCFYTVIFNIFMTIPYGMYLRYYFKYDIKKVIKSSFGLSLFFELTQLSGLYFIYPGPYRLFDIDDLLMNTLGGVIGFYLMGLIKNFLPTRDEIDAYSLEKGKVVSGLRRVTVFCLDSFLYVMISLTILIIFNIKHIMIYNFLIYYGIIPYILKGKTLGSKFLNVTHVSPNYFPLRFFLRSLFLFFFYYILPLLNLLCIFYILQYFSLNEFYLVIICAIVLILTFIFFLTRIISIIFNNKVFYDNIFKVEFESTIISREK